MLDDFFTPCVLVTRTTEPDGYGGLTIKETKSATFGAGIAQNTATEAVIADRVGAKGIYTITTRRNVTLAVNDIVEREKDGARFRVNGIPSPTPDTAQTQYQVVTAEVFA